MALRSEMEEIVDVYKGFEPLLEHNRMLIDIFEGNLEPYLKRELKSVLSEKSYEQIVDRIVPVNLLKRVVDKLSKIYQKGVVRRVIGGTTADSALLTWYEDRFKINHKMNLANEYFNMFKYALVQPLAYRNRVMLRALANDRYFVMSKDEIDPLNPTHVVLVDRMEKTASGDDVVVFKANTASEFLIFDSKMNIRTDEMAAYKNPEGINPYGVLPFQYYNRSTNYLVPKPDTDLLKMVILIPILLSDLAFSIKFSAFSIIYAIDLDEENLTRSPNAFWVFKTDGLGADKKPEIGSIKPEVDIDASIRFIQSVLAFWLQTRGIRPGAVGQLTAENFTSGISKMVDEMDTFEDRERQAEVFKPNDEEMLQNTLTKFHPVWQANGHVDVRQTFTQSAVIEVNFPEQIPLQDRGKVVADQKAEVDAGFTTRRRAIKRLNPGWDDTDIDELMAEIEEEKTRNIEFMQKHMTPGNNTEK